MNQTTAPTATQTTPSTAILKDQSANLRNLEILQKHFPSAIEVAPDGRYTVNAAQLQMALDPSGVKVEEDGFELRWVGKREAYNTAFTPAQNILEPLPQESKNWDSTGNLLLRGDNLDALRLLRHSYFGKVKLIYIDPPYNTQSDAFIYNDNFGVNQTQILEELGYDKDNIEYIKNIYGARTHSGWLSFMYPRLLLAKDLLRDDGVIFISIDDNEQAQLKLLCDEVFGQDNFVANVIWHKKYTRANDAKWFSDNHDHILVYCKNSDRAELNALQRSEKQTAAYSNPDKHVKGDWKATPLHAKSGVSSAPYTFKNGIVWTPPAGTFRRFSNETMAQMDKDKEIWFGETLNATPSRKSFLSEVKDGITPVTIWPHQEVGHTHEANTELKELMGQGVFNNPKPTKLICRILELVTESNTDDLILDFFAGSGTTGEAVMRLNAEDGGNRKFILVQIPQPIDPKKQKEAHKFVTEELGKPATIFEITAERLRRAGEKVLASQGVSDRASQPDASRQPVDIGFRVFEVAPDLNAVIFQKPLSEATQADLAHFEVAAIAASPDQQAIRQDRVLHNLLLSEGLPLTTRITEVLAGRLYQAADVAIFLGAVNGIELADTLAALKASDAPPVYLTIYAPWITDDNFLQNIKTQAESLGFSGDKLRMRG